MRGREHCCRDFIKILILLCFSASEGDVPVIDGTFPVA